MTACEWCWAEASGLAMFSRASISDLYYQVMQEQERAGVDARCPLVRKSHGLSEPQATAPEGRAEVTP